MLGSRVRTCLSTGRWSGLLTVCDDRGERIRCRHPGVPINGRITSISNLEVGSFVEFQCDTGYSMYGDARQECLYFLQWSDDRAPKCINPRYPFDGENVVGKLLQAAEAPFVGKSISGTRSSNIEAYFVIDISDDVRDDALRNSLKFAEERIKNMSRNGRIQCEISAFASERAVLLDLETTTTEEAINNLNNARANRLNILEEIDTRRNTHRAIELLNLTLSSSFSEDPDRTRYVFLFVNGPHAQGEPPNVAMDNIRSIYEGYLLEVYVIAFGDEFQNDQTLNELQSLAPKGNFFPNPPADLFVTSQSGESETDYNDCGRAGDVGKIKNRVAVGKVIGGSFAIDGAWPWQAAFAYRRQSVYSTYNSPIGIFGGGSLINNGWVITAAHIFATAKRIPNWPQSFILTLGTTRLLSNRSSHLSPHTRAFLPERVIIHENYVKGTYDYDIALVKLGQEQEQFADIWLPSERSGKVEYSKRIQRVCLPCTENNCVGKYLRKIRKLNGNEGKEESCRIEGEWLLEEGDNEVIEEKNILTAVTGFGYTDESEPITSNHLKQGLIRLRNRDRCSQDRDLMTRHRPPLPEKVAFTERMTCGIGGGLNSVVDSCTGDSGGPLVREIVDEETGENCWVLIGLVSWGLNCATSYTENNTKKYFPGFYAKTTPFSQWIAQNIDEDEECQERIPANLPPGRKCKKRCQTKTDCGRSSKECICDDVCGMSCINPNLRCENSETFENGVIAGSLIYKSTITYTCNRGYVLSGSNQRTCRSDKKFTGVAPTCRQQRCLVPRAPRFGTISTNERFVLFGESITFTCNPQYEIVGRSSRSLTIECGGNGDWSDEIPTCREIRCRVPDPPEFGSVSTHKQWVLVGEIITYSCNSGYEMVNQASGRLIVACLRNGEWSNDTPQCRVESLCWSSPCHNGRPCTGDDISYTCDCGNNYKGTNCEEGIWRNWEPWSDCTKTCGGGQSYRTRTCPGTQSGDVACVPGSRVETRQCNTAPCQIRRSWSQWGSIERCSVTCGIGVRTRRRTCVGSVGPECQGRSALYVVCERTPCRSTPDPVEITLGGTIYAIFQRGVRYFEAHGSCQGFGRGGRLAMIKTSEVQRRLIEEINRLPPTISYYVGMTGQNRQNWNYADGSRVAFNRQGQTQFQYWVFGEPNDHEGNEHCGVINYPGGRWDDLNCSWRRYYICQRDVTDPCEINPCRNRGTCHRRGTGYICECPDHVSGDNCEFIESFCWDSPCHNGRPCTGDETSYTCDCGDNYKGTNCEEDVTDPCEINPCRNRGTCHRRGTGYICECPDHVSGDICEIKVGPCDKNPCLNGGICNRRGNRFLCGCPNHVSGDNCEIIENLCWSSPCQNQGRCKGNRQSYTCECVRGYGGDRCETGVGQCDNNPCRNGGTCHERGNGFLCGCPAHISGDNCEIIESLCWSSPCQNRGRCRGNLQSYTCECARGYRGVRCETDVTDPCEINPCRNRGSCHSRGTGYICQCPDHVSGDNCEIRVGSCDNNPCRNGGFCNRRGNGFLCDCPYDISGANCEIIESLCWSSPCQNRGRCRGNLQSYTCECARGYGGDSCQTEGCHFDQSLLRDSVRMLGGAQTFYRVGDSIKVSCKQSNSFLNSSKSLIRCFRRDRWEIDYTFLRCFLAS